MSPPTIFAGTVTTITVSGRAASDGDTLVFLPVGNADCTGSMSAKLLGRGGTIGGGYISVNVPSPGGYKVCLSQSNPPSVDDDFSFAAAITLLVLIPEQPTPPPPSPLPPSQPQQPSPPPASPPLSLSSPLPATPAVSLPPSSPRPPPALVVELSLTLVVAGTLDAFDSSAFKASIAAQLSGISPSDITLQVSAASVRVVVTISAPSEAVAIAALSVLTQLAASTEDLSTALGVDVEVVESAPALASGGNAISSISAGLSRAPPPPRAPDAGALAGVVGGAAGGLLLLLLVLIVYRRRRSIATRKAPTNVTATDISFDLEMPSAVSGLKRADEVEVLEVEEEKACSMQSPPKEQAVTQPLTFNTTSINPSTTAQPSSSSPSTSPRGQSSGERERRAVEALTQWEWPSKSVTWGEEIGSGGFGAVFKVKVSGMELAAKCVLLSLIEVKERSHHRNSLLREFRALERVGHPSALLTIKLIPQTRIWL